MAHTEVTYDFSAGANFEATFAVALEELWGKNVSPCVRPEEVQRVSGGEMYHGENVKVGMGTRSPEVGTKLLVFDRVVVQKTKDVLAVVLAAFDGIFCENIMGKTETVGKTFHYLDRETILVPSAWNPSNIAKPAAKRREETYA